MANDATRSLRWSPALLELLMDELHAEEDVENVLGRPVVQLKKSQYARAVGIALILRHSWTPDDLDYVLSRLKLPSLLV